MRKNSQAALEFLTTYGWAFLVILVMISALAYFGILKPSKFLPDRCNFGAEIECMDYTITDNGLNLRLKNNVGEAIVVNALSVSTEKTELSCISSIIGDVWASGDVKDVPIVCGFEGSRIVGGEKEKLNLKLTYYKARSGSSFLNDVQGEVFAVVGSEDISYDYLEEGAGSGEGSFAGLVAAYDFNEGSGTTLTDISGNGNDGAIYVSGRNYIKNPSFEPGTTKYIVINSNCIQLTSVSEDVPRHGTKVAKVEILKELVDGTNCGSGWGGTNYNHHYGFYQNINTGISIGGRKITASAWVKAPVGKQMALLMEATDWDSGCCTSKTITGNGGWQRIVHTWDVPTRHTTESVHVRLSYHQQGTIGDIVYWDGVQVEENDEATEFSNEGWIEGNYNSALDFDGVDDYVDIGNDLGLGENALTVEVWVKYNAWGVIGSSRHYVSDWNTWSVDNQKGFLLRTYQDNKNPQFIVADGVNYYGVSSSQELSLDTWYHIAGIFKANEIFKIYVNGIERGSGSSPSKYEKESATQIYIGRSGINPGYFNGIIDQLAIYDRALTPEEIALHANS